MLPRVLIPADMVVSPASERCIRLHSLNILQHVLYSRLVAIDSLGSLQFSSMISFTRSGPLVSFYTYERQHIILSQGRLSFERPYHRTIHRSTPHRIYCPIPTALSSRISIAGEPRSVSDSQRRGASWTDVHAALSALVGFTRIPLFSDSFPGLLNINSLIERWRYFFFVSSFTHPYSRRFSTNVVYPLQWPRVRARVLHSS
jgi:hypothetical protein